MRINKFLALYAQQSRRGADRLVAEGRVLVNGKAVEAGYDTQPKDTVTLDGTPITAEVTIQTIMFNKPTGYVVSRDGQGSKTIYDLLPPALQHLQPVGRLDKESSGLLLLTNDGTFAETLTHPRYEKQKVYQIGLNRPLQPLHRQMITDIGLTLDDGVSKLSLERQFEGDEHHWIVSMHEGRNRQIRRTFNALGYEVIELHRTHFGQYTLPEDLPAGESRTLSPHA